MASGGEVGGDDGGRGGTGGADGAHGTDGTDGAGTPDDAIAGPTDRNEDAEPTAAPPVLSVALGLSLGGLAVAFLSVGSLVGGAAAAVAVALIGLSLAAPSQRLGGVAAGVFALALIAGGTTGASAGPLVAAAVLAVAAWDVTDHGIGLGEQVGREAATARNEVVHAGVGLAVGGVAGGVAFGVYRTAAGDQPVAALVFLLVGGVLLLAALRR